MIVNYASSIVNKLGASLTNDTTVVIYDRHVFIVQATDLSYSIPGKRSWQAKCLLEADVYLYQLK